MQVNIRRRYFNNVVTTIAAVFGARTLLAQTRVEGAPATKNSGDQPQRSTHIHDGVYYFPGIGANSGSSRDDHITVTDPFDKHVTRTMDALKRSLERAGC